MAAKAAGTFEVTAWDERPYLELADGRKLTRARVTQRFSGDIQGEGSVEWLMFYRQDGAATFVGMQHVVGKSGVGPAASSSRRPAPSTGRQRGPRGRSSSARGPTA